MPSIIIKSMYITIHNGKFRSVKKTVLLGKNRILSRIFLKDNVYL